MREQLIEIAKGAAAEIMAHYDGDMGVTYKADDSPLTRADKAAHNYIAAQLSGRWPDIPVISEEGHIPAYPERKNFARFWLVDPLDGTKEFIKRNGEFTVNIALIDECQPVVSVVGVPVQNLVYSAALGQGSFLHDATGATRRLQAKTEFDSSDLSVSMSRSHPSERLDRFLRSLPGARHCGVGSSLKFCKLAEGEVDFYPRFGPLMEWDTAAAELVSQEAGVVIRTLLDQPLQYNKEDMRHPDGFFAASSQALMDWLLAQLAAVEQA